MSNGKGREMRKLLAGILVAGIAIPAMGQTPQPPIDMATGQKTVINTPVSVMSEKFPSNAGAAADLYNASSLLQTGAGAAFLDPGAGGPYTFDGASEVMGPNGCDATVTMEIIEVQLPGAACPNALGTDCIISDIIALDAAGAPTPWVPVGCSDPLDPWVSWRMDVEVAAGPDFIDISSGAVTVLDSGACAFDSGGGLLGCFPLVLDSSIGNSLGGVGIVGLGGADIAGFDMAELQLYWDIDIAGPAGCDHRIHLNDSFGDGWNGGSVDVLVNAVVVLDDITLDTINDDGSDADFFFTADTGDTITTIFTAGGFVSETSYEIFDGSNISLGLEDPGVDGGGLTVVGSCVVVTNGACCTNEVCADSPDEATCVGGGGTFQGVGVDCAGVLCPPGNDDCGGSVAINEGATPFNLDGATSSGIEVGGAGNEQCDFPFGNQEVNNDLWYNYTPDCDGVLRIDTCSPAGSDEDNDTRIAIYEGCGCPPGTATECNDDSGDATELAGSLNDGPQCPDGGACCEAAMTIPVTGGTCYLVRVGSFASSAQGDDPDTLNLTLDCCGNGQVDAGEDCDGGECCNADCTFADGSVACGDQNDDVCDNPNTCDGAGGCADNFEPDTIKCRASAGICDVAEACDGAGGCPADGFLTGNECRGSTGICDPAEACDGSGADCPADGFSTDTCRPSTGNCDPAESCDGATGDCPGDVTITDCLNDDGCCAPGCNANNDNDCSPVCGNGVVEGLEECDDDNTDPGDGCDDVCLNEGPPVPTVSTWGLMVLALLLLAASKVYFGRRQATV